MPKWPPGQRHAESAGRRAALRAASPSCRRQRWAYLPVESVVRLEGSKATRIRAMSQKKNPRMTQPTA